MTPRPLILSTFTGAGLLDRGFRDEGFCVVSAGDALWGQPIEEFTGAAGFFAGVVGGPPCQKFSMANRSGRDEAAGLALVWQFFRVVGECGPDWFLMENVNGLPIHDVTLMAPAGYKLQRIHLNARELGFEQNRARWYVFGSRNGWPLVVPYVVTHRGTGAVGESRCCVASEFTREGSGGARPFGKFCELQGLPANFDFPHGLSRAVRYRLVGNGVHVGVARALARSVQARSATPRRMCACECGREVKAGAVAATVSCRKRMQRMRDAAIVTAPGPVTPAESRFSFA